MRRLSPFRDPDHSIIQECSGACGDLGTFIPHVIGAITVAGLAPAGVLFGFGAFLIATGLFYGLPLPVQPMKAVSAVILTDGLKPGEVAAARSSLILDQLTTRSIDSRVHLDLLK
jgi:hypothetical protein